MKARIRALVLCTLSMGSAWAAVAQPATPERSYETISQSPRWAEFTRHLRDTSLRNISPERAEAVCRDALGKSQGAAPIDVVDVCIRATLEALDPQSSYITPEALAKERATRGSFAGIGLEMNVKMPGEPLQVVSPIVGAPGQRAGIQARDLIIEIDGVDIKPLGMDAALARLRGPVGSVVELKLLRGGAGQPMVLSVKRDTVFIRTVQHQRVGADIAYLRISQFNDSTPRDFVRSVAALVEAEGPRPAGLVVDLRSNQGGLLEAMLEVASVFADRQAVIVSLIGRDGPMPMRGRDLRPTAPKATDAVREWLAKVPLVVLVNAKTFAGAEALAQFLREQREAKLIGTPTAGLALVRSRLLLDREAALELVSAELSSPKGLRWAGAGLTPDVVQADAAKGEWGDDDDLPLQRALQVLRASADTMPRTRSDR